MSNKNNKQIDQDLEYIIEINNIMYKYEEEKSLKKLF